MVLIKKLIYYEIQNKKNLAKLLVNNFLLTGANRIVHE